MKSVFGIYITLETNYGIYLAMNFDLLDVRWLLNDGVCEIRPWN